VAAADRREEREMIERGKKEKGIRQFLNMPIL
jgi:hypothetical protein